MAQLAPDDKLFSIRHPDLLITDDYLNDPIETKVDQRFEPESVIRQMQQIEVVERDLALFAVVDIGKKGPVYYPVTMYSPLFNRASYKKHIKTDFNEFV